MYSIPKKEILPEKAPASKDGGAMNVCQEYCVTTLCEVCRNALGKCSWSEYGRWEPIDGWEAIRNDIVIPGANRKEESYIVLACPEYVPDKYAEDYPFDREKAERRAKAKTWSIECIRKKEKKPRINTDKPTENKEPLREMNSENRHTTHKLEPCPKCGMDSGKRMQTETVPERFFIVCQSCGYRLGPYKAMCTATQQWDRRYHRAHRRN